MVHAPWQLQAWIPACLVVLLYVTERTNSGVQRAVRQGQTVNDGESKGSENSAQPGRKRNWSLWNRSHETEITTSLLLKHGDKKIEYGKFKLFQNRAR